MKETLAHAINSKNLQQKESNCDIDKIHALGVIAAKNQIGIDAIRMIDGLESTAYKRLVFSLAKATKTKFKCETTLLNKICYQVVKEAAFSFCETCNGRKNVQVGEHIVTCHGCRGSGLKSHSDFERSQAIGIELEAYSKHWAKRFSFVQQLFNTEYASAVRESRKLLE